MTRTELHGLYGITPDQPDTGRLLGDVAEALSGGCRLLQYRDKILPSEEKRLRAEQLLVLCHAHGALLIINDDIELALAANADGLHLGREDGDVAPARLRLGRDKIIGASCYDDMRIAAAAAAAGADYLAFGAVYPSSTKPDTVVAPLSLISEARKRFALPVCAIGGITLENAPPLLMAGASLLAVISDLFAVPAIRQRAAAYQRLFEEQP